MSSAVPDTLRIWTVDFRQASADERERLAVSADDAPKILRHARSQFALDEALVLSTCNRVLWLAAGRNAGRLEFAGPRGARIFEGEAAVRHLARLAVGLESLALGEPQILGQLKNAWEASRNAGVSGPALEFLMPRITGIAKRVRKAAGLGMGATSAAHIGVEHALSICQTPSPRVLMIGAGKMAAIAVRRLRSAGIQTIHVANRTAENARSLAAGGGGCCPVDHAEVFRLVAESTDLVISACAAPHPILEARHFTPGRPVVVVDLAMPRNVAPDAASVPGVRLIDIDGLANAVTAGHEQRREAAAGAEALLGADVERLIERWNGRRAHAQLAAAQQRWDGLRAEELCRARRALPGLTAREWSVVESLAWRLSRKLAHDTVFAARQPAAPA